MMLPILGLMVYTHCALRQAVAETSAGALRLARLAIV